MDRSNVTPISPVKAAAKASKPGPRSTLPLSAASINNEPIELDSTELSPEAGRRRSEAVALNSEERERRTLQRAELADKRKTDQAVMGYVPEDPSSTEFEGVAEHDQQKAASGSKDA